MNAIQMVYKDWLVKGMLISDLLSRSQTCILDHEQQLCVFNAFLHSSHIQIS